MSPSISAFLARWRGSAGNERANKDAFIIDLCEALDVPAPNPKGSGHDGYCFEKDLKITLLDGSTTTGSIDLFKDGAFVLEAKQGSTKTSGGSSPQRGTRAYEKYMENAFGQAVNYAIRLPQRPPFLMTCDIGHAFHVWDSFSGSYGGYGARRSIPITELSKPEIQSFLRTIWVEPLALDPGKRRTLVTMQVAKELGHLASQLESRFPAQSVASFLMRCVFTFFAEDVGLLPPKLFENALGSWKGRPDLFSAGLGSLWDAMNSGNLWGPDKLLRFNGGLFADHQALALAADEISLLHRAARFDWGEVDPSIFGTLLESALSPQERHRLGAHYTPRAFIERIVRPTIEDPLRADWDLAQAEALTLLGEVPDDAARAKSRAVLHGFHQKLANTVVLDPACGSGNFLYVAYDRLKHLEQEVMSRLADMGETRQALALDQSTVTPAHFLGLEVKPWAAAIAELVLWIGHLQWWRRQHPTGTPPEPVLQRYDNIQNRDAVLAWDGEKVTTRTRWDGRTFKFHPVTGLQVPDETAQLPIMELVGARPAIWPEADFIVGNPPFLGNARMRDVLGDGYAEALRAAYPDVPDTVDFVLYWWHKAAEAVRSGRTRRFGLITTNSLRQVRQRGVIAFHSAGKSPLKLLWVIPDHPWTDNGAAVRIAMTVGGMEGTPWLGRVTEEGQADTPEADAQSVRVEGQSVDQIHEDLSAGAKVANAVSLKANDRISTPGVKLHGAGFIVTPEQWEMWGRPSVVHPYRHGRDLTDRPRGVMVIDLFGLQEMEVRDRFPQVYQHVFDYVKPEREQNNREIRRRNWWLFGEPNPGLHAMLLELPRYIATVETPKHRVFHFLDGDTIPDNMLIAIAIDDAFHLGVLSSKIHLIWVTANAGSLGGYIGAIRYNKTRCFDPFPFPKAMEPQKDQIRDLAERLDAHRKAAQGRGTTITEMYNLLAKLRSGEAFTDQERAQHDLAQTEILRQLHDDLDAAVAKAYGWPVDLPEAEILVRLVDLNLERAAEEKRGLVRWLRPEYQAPAVELTPLPASRPLPPARVTPLPLAEDEFKQIGQDVPGDPGFIEKKPGALPWPKELKEQLAAVRSLLLGSDQLWSLDDVAKAFKSRGRYRESIEAHLELLADLTVLAAIDTPLGKRYHRPQAMGA